MYIYSNYRQQWRTDHMTGPSVDQGVYQEMLVNEVTCWIYQNCLSKYEYNKGCVLQKKVHQSLKYQSYKK